MPDHRAHFDFEIRFANGGDLTGTGFRLDLPSADVDEPTVERLLVAHLGLALVDAVELRGLRIVEEPHRGSRGVPRAETRPATRVVDLSHRIRAGLVTYPGLPAPVITPHLTRADSRSKYAPGTEFAMDVITMIGNTGTYLDSPFHRYADGRDLAGLDLTTLVGLRAEVFHLTDAWDAQRRGIRAETLADRDVRGAAVLLHTGWDEHFGTPGYGVGAPFLTAAGAQHLIDAGAALVGIDSVNVDDTESGGEGPRTRCCSARGCDVVEHLTNLGALPPHGTRFTAAPPGSRGSAPSPSGPSRSGRSTRLAEAPVEEADRLRRTGHRCRTSARR